MEKSMNQKHQDPNVQAAIDECLPLIKALGKGRCAVSIGGSRGKRTTDNWSDIDFRLFCDEIVGASKFTETEAWQVFSQAVDKWREKGIEIDYVWPRTIRDVDAQLAGWLRGEIRPLPIVWTLWGYHLLTDLTNQIIVDDPNGIIAAWQAKLTPYPQVLQDAIIKKYMKSLTHWRPDYHYRNKVERGDKVFLASISARLVQDMMQILFALNKTYYVGDGNNLHYVAEFDIKPDNFAERTEAILFPEYGNDVLSKQYDAVVALIDEVMQLVREANGGRHVSAMKETLSVVIDE
ncbi:MAG: DUF4037 domain-containing protein [Chloroflexi bacterium]|nr:MAG: DUF4037 domain-containing protein [Chloroflexota bacterium]